MVKSVPGRNFCVTRKGWGITTWPFTDNVVVICKILLPDVTGVKASNGLQPQAKAGQASNYNCGTFDLTNWFS